MGNYYIGEARGKDGLVLISDDDEYDLPRTGGEAIP